MAIHIKPSKIEHLANLLLQYKLKFKYDVNTLEVVGPESEGLVNFKYASYHSETGMLILMSHDYSEVLEPDFK